MSGELSCALMEDEDVRPYYKLAAAFVTYFVPFVRNVNGKTGEVVFVTGPHLLRLHC